MFERFSTEARTVIMLAQQEAKRLRHPDIGLEHVLLGLIAATPGAASTALIAHGLTLSASRTRVAELVADASGERLDADALAAIGVDLGQVRRAAEDTFGPGALDSPIGKTRSGHLPMTKAAKRSLELALREAVALSSPRITSGHLLLGLLDVSALAGGGESADTIATILSEAHIQRSVLREDVLALMVDGAA
jgi:ATP-dependent Clp protease ATP-binding subunit ClpA